VRYLDELFATHTPLTYDEIQQVEREHAAGARGNGTKPGTTEYELELERAIDARREEIIRGDDEPKPFEWE